jgi:hypothetical protein
MERLTAEDRLMLWPPGRRDNARGNMIGQLVVPLPIGIAAETAKRKATRAADLGILLSSRLVRRALLLFLARHPVSVTTDDIPGPTQPLHLAGARVLEVFPLLPLVARVPLGVGAISYAGQFAIAAVADRDSVPDLETFARGAREELSALAAEVPATSTG